MKKLTLYLATLAMLAMPAFTQQNSAEKAGEKTEGAAEEAGEATKGAFKKVGKATDKVWRQPAKEPAPPSRRRARA